MHYTFQAVCHINQNSSQNLETEKWLTALEKSVKHFVQIPQIAIFGAHESPTALQNTAK